MIPTRLASLVVVVALLAACEGSSPHVQHFVADVRIHTANGVVDPGDLLVAETRTARESGLSGRPELAPFDGMVFVWQEPVGAVFTMKDVSFPLSLAVWSEADRILDILDMTPCPGSPCPPYRPHGPFVGALEVRRGWFQHHGVGIGDRIEVRLLTE